jgi:hypothetical protein
MKYSFCQYATQKTAKTTIILNNTLKGHVTQKLSGYFTILLRYPESFSIIPLIKVVIWKVSP